jgi:hypothetical protein
MEQLYMITGIGMPMTQTPPHQQFHAGRSRGATTSRRRPFWLTVGGAALVLFLLVGLVLAFIDEPLRSYAEREFNRRVDGYTVRIGSLDFHPIGLSVDLKDVTVIQNDHPEPPVARLDTWHASIHWRELLSGNLVSDQSVHHPVLHITRPQAEKEFRDEASIQKGSWQEAVFAIYPLKINEFKLTDGDITYRENERSKPLHVSHLNIRATNIRNVRSTSRHYPSELHADAVLFDGGALTLDGRADFLAEPHAGIKAAISLEKIDLVNLLPLTAQWQVFLTDGMMSTKGQIEYSPRIQTIHLENLNLRQVKLDFVHAKSTAEKEKQAGQKAARTAEKAANRPTLSLRIDEGLIEQSEFGLVNKATDPEYRVFLSDTHVTLKNWSNQLREGTAVVSIKGKLMGTGDTTMEGAFRPETKSPDFSLGIRVWKTQVKSLNNLLRAYGGVDLAAGVFSVFSEMSVKNGEIEGYIKPLFKDVKAYEPKPDEDNGLLKKIFAKIINAASEVLKNTPRGEVATKADVSGPVENPQANTWEMVVTLIQNAFFEAVLPGFEKMGFRK